jgi:hypothetical protein
MPALVARYLADVDGRHPPSLDFLRNLVIALPPLEKQRHWAELLDEGLSSCARWR